MNEQAQSNAKPDPNTIKFSQLLSVEVIREPNSGMLFIGDSDLDGTLFESGTQMFDIVRKRAEALFAAADAAQARMEEIQSCR